MSWLIAYACVGVAIAFVQSVVISRMRITIEEPGQATSVAIGMVVGLVLIFVLWPIVLPYNVFLYVKGRRDARRGLPPSQFPGLEIKLDEDQE